MCRFYRNLGKSTSWNTQRLYRPVQGLLYPLYFVGLSVTHAVSLVLTFKSLYFTTISILESCLLLTTKIIYFPKHLILFGVHRAFALRKEQTFLIINQFYDSQFSIAFDTGYTQKNGAVSKVNKKFISHLTRAQRTPPAAANVQVSHALPAVRFLGLPRGQFPRWRRSR